MSTSECGGGVWLFFVFFCKIFHDGDMCLALRLRVIYKAPCVVEVVLYAIANEVLAERHFE